MKRSQVVLSLIALTVMIPSTAIAEKVHVDTGNVRATTHSDGSVYVNTGETSVSVPTRRRTSWYPWRYWRTPWQSKCRQSSYQQTTQTTNSGGEVVHYSSTSNSCR